MNFDMQKVVSSKEAYRKKLAALSFTEKLRILEAIRKRDLAFRKSGIEYERQLNAQGTPPK